MPKENNKIVIIVGAGASADFKLVDSDHVKIKFPVGEELINLIANEQQIQIIFENLKINSTDIEKYNSFINFSKLVQYYQPFSIDEILDSIARDKLNIQEIYDSFCKKVIIQTSNEDLLKSGKTLIAYFLLRSEKREWEHNQAKIWYRHIRNFIINSGNNQKEIKEKLKNLVIISFNYDRSLEFYLRSRLPEYFYEINILYPYGKLADNSFVANRYCEFNDDVKTKPITTPFLEEIEKIAEQIQVIGEKNLIDNIDENNNLIFDNCKKWFEAHKKDFKLKNAHPSSLSPDVIKNIIYLSSEIDLKYDTKYDTNIKTFNELTKQAFHILSANKIYFLGFAFHKPNIELLCLDKIKEWHDGKKIYYTNFDNSLDIENKVSNLFSGDLFIKIPSIKKGVYDALINDFKIEFE
jgi:hypothetical protein